jgi:hypothetical protein
VASAASFFSHVSIFSATRLPNSHYMSTKYPPNEKRQAAQCFLVLENIAEIERDCSEIFLK